MWAHEKPLDRTKKVGYPGGEGKDVRIPQAECGELSDEEASSSECCLGGALRGFVQMES
jgi:hypothetical protein